MALNGEKELRALAKINHAPFDLLNNDPQVALPVTASLSADMVDWLGFYQLVMLPEHRNLLHKKGLQIENGETSAEFIRRVWPLLGREEAGIALQIGLETVASMEKVSNTGINLRIWRAAQSSEWTNVPNHPDTLREWIRYTLVDEMDGSSSSATHLANVVEAVQWLSANSKGLPRLKEDGDNEPYAWCFRSPYYRRMRSIAAKVLRMRDAPPEQGEEVAEEIEALVEAVLDVEQDIRSLEKKGAKSPPLPPIVATEGPKRDAVTGEYLVAMKLTEAQRSLFQRKLGSDLEYKLDGEVYDKHQLVQYRYIEDVGDCRIWVNDRWTDWVPGDVSLSDGYFDTVAYQDEESNITVLNYWEKPKEESLDN